ncbi:MAG: ABC transporter ATP-binding protein [Planctomycetes bacterium]|nr:ABC transporter ATP-binding protein [Planctomycetota bacterium]
MRVEIRGLSKRYGRRTVLDGVSLSIEPGEFLAILGPSGAGKSTLLSAVAGLLAPDAGRIDLDGLIANDPAIRIPPSSRKVGMVFQNLALWPHLSVEKHLSFVAPGEDPTPLLARFGLGPLRKALPAQLSGGEAQRLALARALAGNPRILLLDEPLGSLDRPLRDRLAQEIASLHASSGTTTILVTHDYDEALRLSGRVAVLAEGRVEQVGSPEEVYRRPATRRVAELTGPVSFVPAPDGREYALRPDEIRLVESGEGEAEVAAARFASGRWRIQVRFRGTLLEADSPVAMRFGVRVAVSWSEACSRVPGREGPPGG